jgi:hypothetical protein
MTVWHTRTVEQRNLLNPAFCAIVLLHLAEGYAKEAATTGAEGKLPLELAFVGPSLVLRGQTRFQLPSTVRTSLATWIQEHPLERSAIAKGVVVLRTYVREALIFGAQHGVLGMDGRNVVALDAPTGLAAYWKASSAEVRDCFRIANFVGRWLWKAGPSSTVLSLVGVQP